jgi:hypothetical protein
MSDRERRRTVPATVVGCLLAGELRLLLWPSRTADKPGFPRDVPIDLVPPDLRMPNSTLWLDMDSHGTILRVRQRLPAGIEWDYWMDLEFRICSELRGMRENHLRFLWCDGIHPEEYLLDEPSPRITGRAWICNGDRQDKWSFRLFLNKSVGSMSEIDWPSLLPPKDVTRWLAVDVAAKEIQIDPSAAVPDSAE